MRIPGNISLILILIAIFHSANGQDNTPPVKPEISYVTVDTANNDVVISWIRSPSDDVEKYLLYYEKLTVNGYEGIRLDSVGAGVSSYIHPATNAGSEIMLYSVTAVDSSGNESIRKPGLHSTIHSAIFYDSCNHANIVSWNKYFGWGNNVSGYRIYGRNGNGPFTLLGANGSIDTIFRHSSVADNTNYSYFITGVKNDGLNSNSNICTKYTHAPSPPGIMRLNYATVKDNNTVELKFEFSGTSEVNDFVLLRSRDLNSSFNPVSYLMDVSSSPVIFEDNIHTQNESYYYRIGAVNTCLSLLDTTNLARNVLLTVKNEDRINRLEWNDYIDFPGGLTGYEIYRTNQAGEIMLIGVNSPSGTEFEDDLASISGLLYEGKIAYEVHAVGGEPGTVSVSNRKEAEIKTEIIVPTAFTPNADGKNDVFKPVIDFIPDDYLLVVTNRYGTVIYRSGDPEQGWDGTINSQQRAPEGIYTYFIKCTSFNGQKSMKQGSVTLFYP